jgi:hypothetical protein
VQDCIGKPDYLDYATLLELTMLVKDEEKASKSLSAALAVIHEVWNWKRQHGMCMAYHFDFNSFYDLKWPKVIQRFTM